MKCPNCGLDNPDSTIICDCGYNFVKREIGSKLEENIKNPNIQNENKGSFWSFDKMVSGRLIKILYILGLISITISGFTMFRYSGFLLGLVMIVIGNLFWRIMCEAIIIVFKIFEKLNQIEHKL